MKAKDPSTRLVESISMDVKDWWPKHIVESAWLEHTPFAAWLISALQPRIMVELGTHRAVSYMAFCQASSKLSVPAKCFAVDTWKGDDHAGKYSESIFRDVQDLNQPYENFSTLVRSKFDEALSQFQDGSIDLLHIDGFHTYEAVSHDFNSWLPKMSQRGVVLFHDTAVHKKDFGVWRLWSELSEQHPHFHFSHGFGLGVLSVGANPCPLIQCLCALVSDQKKYEEIQSIFALRGRDVSLTYQKRLDAAAGQHWRASLDRNIKRLWRTMIPISLREKISKMRR